ncbi:MAG: adenine-specific methyltransferase EcoRI family protein [Candidatus Nomurabacteria bacterium]|nr:MAG: adenine-specific methyltransferase EcoRI family protein [Candidatus Nomurabacteria bacterium]
MAQKVLQKAKQSKKDEFYTQSKDIEDELRYYKAQFKGKTVYCNCDDPYESNFFRYFVLNFKQLELKSLITTSYKPSPIDEVQLTLSLGIEEPKMPKQKGRPKVKAKRFVINDVGDIDGDGAYNLADVAKQLQINKNNEWVTLKGDKDYPAGDFRSKECVALLEKADIVVTNPPFSLFREYIAQLVEHDKKFLIIGNKNAITYKETFSLIKDNKLWLGYRNINSDMWFEVPEDQAYEKMVDGKKVKHIMACWFTNLDTTKRHEEFEMYRSYTPELYPHYDNYDAINVNVVADIPKDYTGVMGVPITFLDKFNPSQFKLLGQMVTTKIDDFNFGYPYLNGKKIYARILIKNKKVEK